MKVFISFLITGMESLRAAARNAVLALGHQPLMAEDFGARPQAPQLACLEGVREADAVILVLGERYGARQPSGVSATHEEYREAQETRPVLAFVEDGVHPEPDQAAFIDEVQAWSTGLFRAAFSGAEDLQRKVTRALHEWQLATATAPIDPSALLARALALFPQERHASYGSPSVSVVVASGPAQPVLRPSQIEDPAFGDALLQAALFGAERIFSAGEGSRIRVDEHRLVLEQEGRHPRRLALDGQGGLTITLPLEYEGHGLSVLIEETVTQRIGSALGYAKWLLDHIDPTQRLSHIVIAARITDAGHSGWRTQREHAASPNSMQVGFGRDEHPPVHLDPPQRTRAAFRLDAARLIEDLVVLLRRQWRN